MATIKAGTYRFNDVLTQPSGEIWEELVASSADTNITMITGESDEELFVLSYYNPHQTVVYSTVAVSVYIEGWQDEAYKTITIPNDTEVSAEFAEWFSANAAPVAEGVQISGVWKFKDVPTLSIDIWTIEQAVNFTVNQFIISTEEFMGYPPGEYYLTYHCHNIWFTHNVEPLTNLNLVSRGDYSKVTVNSAVTVDFDGSLYLYDYGGSGVDPWYFDKVVDFGTEPQIVSAEFYNWLIANATQPCASITHNGEAIASLFPGQTATLKCAGMKMAGDVVVEIDNIDVVAGEYDGDAVIEGEPTGGVGDANIVPLTVTENGVYDTYYETATEVWDNNTEYAGSVTVDGVTLNFKKAEHLIVPDDLNDLKNSSYVWQVDMDGDIDDGKLDDVLVITSGVVAAWHNYAVLWVKMAAPLNAQFGISFLEDNTAYITNYLQFANAAYRGIENTKVSITAPSKKVENTVYFPVTVALPISDEELHIKALINKATVYDYDRTGMYYTYLQVDAIPDNVLIVSPQPTVQEFIPDDDKPFTRVSVQAVDLSDLSSMHILCGIYMKTLPQTQYAVGEWPNPDGGVIVAQYTDGTTAEVPLSNDYIWGFATNKPGVRRVTVKYSEGGITSQTVYDITVT